MTRQRQRQNSFLLASLVVTVLGIVEARAEESASPPASEPLAAHQHRPTIKDAYKAAVTQRMKDHTSTLVGRYKGKIQSRDVVNEAINDRRSKGTNS